MNRVVINYGIGIIFTFLTVFLGYLLFETYCFRVTEIEFTHPRIPKSFAGKKLVFISDIHHGPFVNQTQLEVLVNRVNSLNPDLILLGGDYVLFNRSYIKACFNKLSRLRASLGIYGVLGNHDYYEGKIETLQAMKNAKIIPLVNQNRWLKLGSEKIMISGLDDYLEGNVDIDQALTGATEKDFVVLLSHNPDNAELLKDSRAALTLSGHTHGGQLNLFGVYAPVLHSDYGQKYTRGMVQAPQTKVFVSTGFGTVFIPLRFFARAEIVVIRLKS